MRPTKRHLLWVGGFGSLLALGLAGWMQWADIGKPSEALWGSRQVTYSRDVAPILFENCAECHRPGQSGPFPLLTYEDVRDHARQIVEVTESGFMPPWLPNTDRNAFLGQRELSRREIATLRRWYESGMPRGDPDHRPPKPDWEDGWPLGEPDLMVEMPEPYPLQAEGRDVYRNFAIPLPVDEPRYVRTVDLQPDDPKVVHHAVMQVDRSGTARELDRESPRPGYGGGMVLGEASLPGGHFLGWTPGKTPFPGYEELAWRLEPGTDLVLQLHLRPSGKPEDVGARVGFYWADDPPTREPYAVVLRDKQIDIPAGAKDHVVRETYELPVDVKALMVYPHAHYICREMKAFATLPDGRRKWLIHIPEWDFNWQDAYRYAEPIALPAGTEITMAYTYDNSADNVFNPNYPPERITYGPQSSDEMAELLLQVLPEDPADLYTLKRHGAYRALKKEIARKERHLEAHPEDVSERIALGRRYRQVGAEEAAEAQFREALALRPEHGELLDSAIAHNELAGIEKRRGRLAAAIDHYRQAREARRRLGKDHNTARATYLLADTLAAAGKLDEAVDEFEAALELKPEEPEILNGLARVLAIRTEPESRDAARAIELAGEAVRLTRQTDPRMLETLSMAEAAGGNWDRAIESAEQARQMARQQSADRLAEQIRQRIQAYRQAREGEDE